MISVGKTVIPVITRDSCPFEGKLGDLLTLGEPDSLGIGRGEMCLGRSVSGMRLGWEWTDLGGSCMKRKTRSGSCTEREQVERRR